MGGALGLECGVGRGVVVWVWLRGGVGCVEQMVLS